MDASDAVALIEAALPPTGPGSAVWADLGAGSGTFTRALATRLGPRGRVHAVDADRSAVAALQRLASGLTGVTATLGDFAAPDARERLGLPPLDGALIANALHFVPAAEQPAVLACIAGWLRNDGRIVVIEYESRAASRWVPYPVSFDRLRAMMPTGMTSPTRVATQPSAFGGSMYVAYMVVGSSP